MIPQSRAQSLVLWSPLIVPVQLDLRVLSRLLRSGKDDVLQERVIMCDISIVAT